MYKNIVIKPIMKMTLEVRGNKLHRINDLVDEFYNMDSVVAVVDCGIVPYKDITYMGRSLTTYATKTHRKLSFHKIKDNNREVIIFKV